MIERRGRGGSFVLITSKWRVRRRDIVEGRQFELRRLPGVTVWALASTQRRVVFLGGPGPFYAWRGDRPSCRTANNASDIAASSV